MRRAALLVVLVAAMATGPTTAARPPVRAGCLDYSAGDDCEGHDCTTCQMDLGITKISFCVDPETAEALPKEMFTCGVQPPTPPGETGAAAALGLGSDECSDLDKAGCEGAGACAWCVAAAVPSACYTVEQAKRLPAAVFACEMPDAAAALA